MNEMANHFKIFFSKYLWLGVVWLLLSIILNKYYGQVDFVVYVVIQLVQSISVSIIVAAIFSYTLGTEEFLDKIKELLEEIVVSRRFLGNLSKKGKEEALHAILKASDVEKDTYLNIDRYYDNHINNSLCIRNKCVRSNYTITARAFIDKNSGRVGVSGIYSYRLYPSDSGFCSVNVGFDEEDVLSRCEKVVVHKANGEREVFDDIELTPQDSVGSKDRLGTIDVNALGEGQDHLDIEIHVIEFGFDHWFMFTFKALQPTDGFRLNLICADSLEVRKHCIFDTGNAYHVDMHGKQEMNIACHQWIKEGVGVSILISIPHELSDVDDVQPRDVSKETTTLHVV